jgi:hypothetical protein
MPEPNFNEHHCVPHSFDGASSAVNLTRLAVGEHNAFHKATGHTPPDFFIRRFLIGSIPWEDGEGRSFPQGAYKDLLTLLTPDDWRTLYHPATFLRRTGRDAGEGQRVAKASFHIAWYLTREMSLTMDQIGLLGIHMLPPHESGKEMMRIERYFKKDRPHVLLRKFLLETSEAGDPKWVKPMQEDVRRELLRILRNSKLEERTSNGESLHIFDLLLDHHARLVECAKGWQPQLRDHAGTLKRLLSERMK